MKIIKDLEPIDISEEGTGGIPREDATEMLKEIRNITSKITSLKHEVMDILKDSCNVFEVSIWYFGTDLPYLTDFFNSRPSNFRLFDELVNKGLAKDFKTFLMSSLNAKTEITFEFGNKVDGYLIRYTPEYKEYFYQDYLNGLSNV